MEMEEPHHLSLQQRITRLRNRLLTTDTLLPIHDEEKIWLYKEPRSYYTRVTPDPIVTKEDLDEDCEEAFIREEELEEEERTFIYEEELDVGAESFIQEWLEGEVLAQEEGVIREAPSSALSTLSNISSRRPFSSTEREEQEGEVLVPRMITIPKTFTKPPPPPSLSTEGPSPAIQRPTLGKHQHRKSSSTASFCNSTRTMPLLPTLAPTTTHSSATPSQTLLRPELGRAATHTAATASQTPSQTHARPILDRAATVWAATPSQTISRPNPSRAATHPMKASSQAHLRPVLDRAVTHSARAPSQTIHRPKLGRAATHTVRPLPTVPRPQLGRAATHAPSSATTRLSRLRLGRAATIEASALSTEDQSLLGDRPRRRPVRGKASNISVGSLVGESWCSTSTAPCSDTTTSFQQQQRAKKKLDKVVGASEVLTARKRHSNVVVSEAQYFWKLMSAPIRRMRQEKVDLQRSQSGCLT